MTISQVCGGKKSASPANSKSDVASSARRLGNQRWAWCLAVVLLGLNLLVGCKGGNSAAVSITIGPSSSPSVDQNQIYNFTATVANDTTNEGVTWSLNSTGCSPAATCGTLTNVTAFTVTYTAPGNLTAAQSITVTATSKAKTSVTATATVNVVIPAMFTTGASGTQLICSGPCQLANAQNGVSYSQTITATDGVTPLLFSLKSGGGNLPPGLTLNSSGLIVGTPTSPTVGQSQTTYVFTVNVTDSATPPLVVAQQFSITAQPPTQLSITTAGSLAAGFINGAYSARVAVSGGTAPFTWSLASGTLPPGLVLSPTSGQITGVPTVQAVTYPATYAFKVQVQDSSIPAQTVTTPSNLSITIQQPAALTISSSSILPAGTTAVAYSASLLANGGIAPYSWTLTSGQLPAGLSLASNGTISGVPILATSPPTASTFTVQLTDSEVTPQTASQTFSITINQGTTNDDALFSGQYAFLFKGFDTNGAVSIAGTFIADGNGSITAGIEDSNRISSGGIVEVVNAASLTGSYTVNSDGRGFMELVAVNPSTNVPLVVDYRLVIDSSGNARFFENNSTTTSTDTLATHGEGTLKNVTGTNGSSSSSSSFSASAFSGNYAFEFTGQDLSAKPVALAGVVNANGTSNLTVGGTGPNSDLNDAGTFSSQNLSGDFSVQSNFNRGSATVLFEIPGKAQFTLTFNFFFASPSDIYFIEVDSPTTTTVTSYYRLSGEMILQQSGYQFQQSSLAGSSVATGSGINGCNNASVFAGLLASAGTGSATFSYDENNGGVVAGPSFSGTYSVGTNGRVPFTNLGSSAATQRLAVAYLTGPGQGFLIGSDAAVTGGRLEQQTVTSFPGSLFEGSYALGTAPPADANVANIVGQVESNGLVSAPGGVTGFLDEFDPPTTANPEGLANIDKSLIATVNSLSSTTGRGVLATNSPPGVPVLLDFYIVSPNVVRAIPADASGDVHPQVILLDH